MKRLTLTLLALAVATAFSYAQPLGPEFRFGVQGNFTLSNLPGPAVGSSSSLKDAYGNGWGGGAHLDVQFLVFGFRLSADYMKYSLDQDKFRAQYTSVFGSAASQISIDGGGLSIFTLTANGKMNLFPFPIVKPYLTGGVGLAWLTVGETTTSISGVAGKTSPSSTESAKTSVNIGVGTDISLGITLFAEVRYVWIFTPEQTSSYVPVTIGLTF